MQNLLLQHLLRCAGTLYLITTAVLVFSCFCCLSLGIIFPYGLAQRIASEGPEISATASGGPSGNPGSTVPPPEFPFPPPAPMGGPTPMAPPNQYAAAASVTTPQTPSQVPASGGASHGMRDHGPHLHRQRDLWSIRHILHGREWT